jgi:hypothetical protein
LFAPVVGCPPPSADIEHFASFDVIHDYSSFSSSFMSFVAMMQYPSSIPENSRTKM